MNKLDVRTCRPGSQCHDKINKLKNCHPFASALYLQCKMLPPHASIFLFYITENKFLTHFHMRNFLRSFKNFLLAVLSVISSTGIDVYLECVHHIEIFLKKVFVMQM